MEERVKKIMEKRFISSSDEVEDAINLVTEILDAEIKHTEANEPFATRSIKEMRIASDRVQDLRDLL